MKVLVACEESQVVCKEFRLLGHEAYSCDLKDCSGGHPDWHFKGDALSLIRDGFKVAMTRDGVLHELEGWDIIIAHPPCTYLTCTGNKYFSEDKYGYNAIKRYHDRLEAIDFFMKFVFCSGARVAIENPIGIMSSVYRKPNQIIQPWQFDIDGTEQTEKSTCLWLRGLPELTPINTIKPEIKYHVCKSGKRQTEWYYNTRCAPRDMRATLASKTFKGIAKAMAEQWGGVING